MRVRLSAVPNVDTTQRPFVWDGMRLISSLRRVAVGLGNRVPSRLASALSSDSKIAAIARPLVNVVVPDRPTVVVVRSGEAKGMRLAILPREEKYYWSGDHEPAVQRS